MIVTVVADVLGEANNGTTIAAYNIINALKERGHTVKVLCGDEDKRGQEGYYIVPTRNFGLLQPILDHNGVSLAKPDKDVVRKAIEGSDEVHILLPFKLGIEALKAAHSMGIPCSCGFHVQAENVTSHLFNLMGNERLNTYIYRRFDRKFFKYIDAIHYPTEFIKDTFENASRHKTNAYVISNGVNRAFVKKEVERPEELKGKTVILCIGRLSKEKMQKILIDAVYQSKHEKDIVLSFAGCGPKLASLKKRASKLTNQPIFGFYGREELIDVINSADLYVHSSEIEIEAISCLEAISCGLVPIINNSMKSATRYFALDSEKNLFKKNDSADLAAKIDYWIEHPEEKVKAAKAYESYANQFNFDDCMDKMEKMIREVSRIKVK